MLATAAALLPPLALAASESASATPVHASDVAGAPGLSAPVQPTAGSYRAVFPTRLVDTRTTGSRLRPGGRLVVPVLGRAGTPTSGVGAVQLHVTAVGGASASHLTVHASGTAVPTASSLNFAPGLAVANTVLARPGADGAVTVTNGASAVDVVVDVVGWYAASPRATSEGVHPVAPTRVLDTRRVGRPVSVTPTTVRVTTGPVPAGATAVVANLTTVSASASGLPLLSWASGQPRPTTSNGNTVRGQAVATQAVVGVGRDGRIALATGGGSTHLVVDVVGYVIGPGSSGGHLRPVPATRLVDTRTTGVPLASGQRLAQRVTGRGGVPVGASAALLTVTSVPGRGATGTLVLVGNGERTPPTSDLNARADVPVARQVLVPLGVDGGVAVVRSGGTGHVVVDLVGYVTAVPAPTAVAPAAAATLAPGVPAGPLRDEAVSVLGNAVRHGLSVWWPRTAPSLLARPMDGNAQSDATDAIRRLSMEALGVSTALATGSYDPQEAGMSRAQGLAVVEEVVGTVACRHRATRLGGWGHSWQSPMWSSLAARAGWLSWSGLTERTRTCVRDMVVSEADFASTVAPYVMVSRSGVVLRPGNSGAEENSWFSLAPAVALAMLPTAERRDTWRATEVRFLANSFSRKADLTSTASVDGVPLRSLLVGWNVNADGSVVNHDRIAPDYSTNAYQNIDTVLLARLAGADAPESALVGLSSVYAGLATNVYDVGAGYAAPGGSVYRPNTGDGQEQAGYGVYYPQGCDWGEGQVLPFALLDAQAVAFGFDDGAEDLDARGSASRHLAHAVEMQARSADGRMYVDPTEYTYVGREEHTAQLAAQLVLTLVLAPAGRDDGDDDGVEVAPEAVSPTAPLDGPPTPGDESRLIDPRVSSDR
ncbi:hypothetical protein G7075_01710 [Phycicoccus sp. HDW14]|uniref:hypothetical protein n=1 Tax=Phycicoccus sp. HDW14 TaxID=2714941 RepID=UPI00140B0336|nr:hypothetical protein [Phycicoccus sp. HDW14]QIM20159.1 hypothetical protein G7075_01710 [Phycicoccus sp. HDW14]